MKNSSIFGTSKNHTMPFVRLELVVLSVIDGVLNVLLSHRKEEPHKGAWGLPGGVLRIDADASLELGAQRVAAERLGRELPNLSQVISVGGAERDPRAPWALSIVYRCLVPNTLETSPGKRVEALAWQPCSKLASKGNLAFDHAQLIALAVASTQSEIRVLRYPTGWMSEAFTLGELQAMSEAVIGAPLDKVTFRRRIEVAGVAQPIEGKTKMMGAHRPAQLYALNVV
jgi:8-oxo-dGTP diphosphatase